MVHATQKTHFGHATLLYVCDLFFVRVHATQNMNSAHATFDDALKTRSYFRPLTQTQGNGSWTAPMPLRQAPLSTTEDN
jgi:hypothetical protein